MATQDPDLAEVIEAALEIHQSSIYTMLPGRVESYDRATQTADVQPLVANTYITDDDQRVAERHPVAPGVPIAFPRGGGYRMVWELQPGDEVMLLYSSRSMSELVSAGAQVSTSDALTETVPAEMRANHLSDPIAIPGLGIRPLKRTVENGMSIGQDDSDGVIDIIGDEVRIGKDADQDIVGSSAITAFMLAMTSAIAATDTTGVTPNPTTNACLKTLKAFLDALVDSTTILVPPLLGTGWTAGTAVGKVK